MGQDAGGVRIAELVATLSYAADLGLGQPMEHCLRQTVIALRLADLAGADDGRPRGDLLPRPADERLLPRRRVRAGALVRRRHRVQGRRLRDRSAMNTAADGGLAAAPARLARQRHGSRRAGWRRSRSPGSGRWTTCLTTHTDARLAVRRADRARRRCRRSRSWQAYEQWDGKGPRHAARRRDPPAGAAGAAGRAHRGLRPAARRRDARRTVARRHAGQRIFDPDLVDLFVRARRRVLDGLDEAATWDAVLDAEPRLARRCRRRRARRRARGDGRPRRPQVAVPRRPLARRGQPRRRGGPRCPGSPEPSATTLRRAGLSTTSAGSASPTRSGTSRARSPTSSGSACACTPT